jgi:phosphomethylpyrimidine synthase
LKQYDVTLILGSALQPGSLYDANDPLHFSELHVFGELTQKAKEYGIQIILEGSGHTPLNKTQEVIKEQQYVCRQTPILATSPFSTDIAHGYEHIASAIGAAHIAWMGTSLIADREPQTDKETIKNKLIAHKIAAHSADLAKGHPGSQIRDNALSKALFEGRRKDVNHLSLDSGRISKLI